jgi:hypothetical protein
MLSPDPVGPDNNSGANFNRYWYANNNPIKFVDPDGRASEMALDRWAETVGRNPEMGHQALPLIAGAAMVAATAGVAVEVAVVINAIRWGYAAAGIQGAAQLGAAAATPAASAALAEVSVGGAVASTAKMSQVSINRAAGNTARDSIAAARPGSLIEQNFQVTGGLRRVDVLDGLTAIESKVGRTSLTPAIRQELARDVKMLRSGQVGAVEWHFSPSQITGQSGPTGPLRQKLNNFGIPIVE